MSRQRSADAVVVGGGIIGLSVAYHLADAGVEDVVVLERDGVASKASGRAAGYISSYMFNEYSAGTNIIDYCLRFHESLEETHDAVTHHAAEAYTVAHTADGRERLEALQETVRVDCELINGDEYGAREPDVEADGVTGALSFGTGLHTDPYSTTMAVLDEAQALGVTLRNEGVTDVSTTADGLLVTTDEAAYATPTVVNAAGAWSNQVAAMVGLSLPLKPRPSEIAVFETEADLDFPLLNCPDLQLYARQEPNGDLLVGAGGNHEVSDPDDFSTQASEAFLQAVAEKGDRITPYLLDAGMVNNWAGRCSATPDRRPLIGETSVEGFYVCAGMNGAGIMHSPFAGRLMADIVTGADSPFEPDWFVPERYGEESFEIKNAIDW